MGYVVSLFLGTFILEDAALVTALALVRQGVLPISVAFAAVFSGIVIGDLALYFLGRSLRRAGRGGRRFQRLRSRWLAKIELREANMVSDSESVNRHFDPLIFISRVLPGTRLPTYLAAGFFQVSCLRFTVLTVLSVGLWVGLVFSGGAVIQVFVKDHIFLSVCGLLLSLVVFRWLVRNLKDRWTRRAFFQSWRKWSHFEFWPAWFFYIPIAPYYIYLSI